ncbi:MmgE/PrpD family protein [Bordetella genomosp. 13]|uniref:MmgE/PrpD family protein n=1 Tax=Bordetella genomosp. 13 TaxID=463040 RepID=UPI0016428CBE|nr:MmgE/PrpD family protein [Bordetella genomosp. 13]
MGATSLLGGYAAQAHQAALTPDVADKAAACLLDSLGVGLLAHREHTFLVLRELVGLAAPGSPSARCWADGIALALHDAVQANAAAVHGQFHDDTDYASWTHPASLVVPVVLGVAEARGATLQAALRGIAAGYAAISWLGGGDGVARALIGRGLRASPVLGCVAAAVAAAAALELDAARAASAVGMAASLCGGTLEPVRCGSDEWRIQNARAAGCGLMAAQLAQRGVQGAPAGLEGPRGLLHALAGLPNDPDAWTTPPDPRAILGVVAKPWACLGDNMSAVIAARLVHAEGRGTRDIRAVDILIWRHFTEYPGTAYQGPYERVAQAVASMAFSTAAMLVYGELEYDKPLDHRDDPEILRLVPLIHIQPDDAGGPYDAVLEVRYADGTRRRVEAAEAGDAMLRHDRATSASLLDERLARAGRARGNGAALAQALHGVLDGEPDISVRAWLNGLYLEEDKR